MLPNAHLFFVRRLGQLRPVIRMRDISQTTEQLSCGLFDAVRTCSVVHPSRVSKTTSTHNIVRTADANAPEPEHIFQVRPSFLHREHFATCDGDINVQDAHTHRKCSSS
eukprot:TRINITY_DN8432_c0_g1_i1.p1 TRINITY_DN8432_c0_g1~~TRINITY_DN8432_c0_g1_i1.p1  ORF type:complete len:109 (-),score=5.76 TRINITY_DN8432_c0_g1_i1:635-961(-)